MCLNTAIKYLPSPANNDFTCRNRIQEKAERNLPESLARRQILRHHDQVIPEIQKTFIEFPFGNVPPPT